MHTLTANPPSSGDHAHRRRSLWRLLTMPVLLALALAAMFANLATAAPAVSFKATISGTLSLVSAGPGGPLSKGSIFALTGTDSQASQMGRVQYSARVTVTSNLNPATGVIKDQLTETLTAANGDTLTIFCTQVATLDAFGQLHGIDTWTVVGGTGRFSGATGSGTGQTTVDLNTGTFTKVLTGTIT